MKTCTKCHRTLPLSEFYKNPTCSDGLYNLCQECFNWRRRQGNYTPSPNRRRVLASVMYMPFPHIWETLKDREIIEALKVSQQTVRRLRKDPYLDWPQEGNNPVQLDDAADQKIRKWLEEVCLPESR